MSGGEHVSVRANDDTGPVGLVIHHADFDCHGCRRGFFGRRPDSGFQRLQVFETSRCFVGQHTGDGSRRTCAQECLAEARCPSGQWEEEKNPQRKPFCEFTRANVTADPQNHREFLGIRAETDLWLTDSDT